MMLLIGDVREKLKEMDYRSVQCCVTSPPYWGLRDYGTAEWEGGDENCEHIKEIDVSKSGLGGGKETQKKANFFRNTCNNCGAKRKDSQLGLEETPEEYVENMVKVFREIKRVLKDDGTCWLNLGDSYSSGQRTTTTNQTVRGEKDYGVTRPPICKGIKPKDLVGIPWRVALALQQDGWYLRQDIIWHKPNPMPESVQDRCTKSHEYIFLLTKSARYYYDADSIREPVSEVSLKRAEYGWDCDRPSTKNASLGGEGIHTEKMGSRFVNPKGRNKRSVWTITTKPFKDAHFAVFPIEIPTYCIKAGSKEGDTILDPFMGSGTTALAAQEHGRKWVGVELNPEYAEIIKKRTSQTVLF